MNKGPGPLCPFPQTARLCFKGFRLTRVYYELDYVFFYEYTVQYTYSVNRAFYRLWSKILKSQNITTFSITNICDLLKNWFKISREFIICKIFIIRIRLVEVSIAVYNFTSGLLFYYYFTISPKFYSTESSL